MLATDAVTTRTLLVGAGIGDEAYQARVAAIRSAPPFAVWRLWLDRAADAERAPFLGTAGFGPLDNISLLERFEEGARRWSAASRRLGGRAARVRAGRRAGRGRSSRPG